MPRAVGAEAVPAEPKRLELRVGAQHRSHRPRPQQAHAAVLQLEEPQPAVGRQRRRNVLSPCVADRSVPETQLRKGDAKRSGNHIRSPPVSKTNHTSGTEHGSEKAPWGRALPTRLQQRDVLPERSGELFRPHWAQGVPRKIEFLKA